MKMGKNLVLFGVVGLVAVCMPRVAMGENAAVEAPMASGEVPVQPTSAPAPDKGPTTVNAPMGGGVVPAQPTAAPAPYKSPMGEFTLTPKIGYVYLGGQKSLGMADNSVKPIPFEFNINAMQIQLDLTFGGRGAAFELAPFYMLMKPDVAGSDNTVPHTMHAGGIYLGILYNWYIPTAKIGTFYPGVGFGWSLGGLFGGQIDYGIMTSIRIPVSCTWYFSRTLPIGIMLEWGFGFQTNMYAKKYTKTEKNEDTGAEKQEEATGIFLRSGFYTDLTVGVRFL